MALDTGPLQPAEPAATYQPGWIERLPLPALAIYGGLWVVLAGIAHFSQHRASRRSS